MAYREQENCHNGLNNLLEKNAFDHSPFGHQILIVLLILGVQPIILKRPQQNINPGIYPVDYDRDKSTQQFIGHRKTHASKITNSSAENRGWHENWSP